MLLLCVGRRWKRFREAEKIVSEKTGTIYIKWVRSGIGFSRRQKELVKSIGLRRLNQVVERPDTVHMRGLVASVPHLVEVVDLPASSAWTDIPEYTIIPIEAKPKKAPRVQKTVEEVPAETPATGKGASAASASAPAEPAVAEKKPAAPRKKAAASKPRAGESSKKVAAASSEKPKPRRKTTEAKSAAKKESKPKKGKK